MAELIEMPYGNGKSLSGEFLKAYTEVQLKPCPFCGSDKISSNTYRCCPNAKKILLERYGIKER